MENAPSPTKKPWVQRRDKNEETNPRTPKQHDFIVNFLKGTLREPKDSVIAQTKQIQKEKDLLFL
jgi:hypothetical protein